MSIFMHILSSRAVIMGMTIDEKATEKQVKYATDISNKLKIQLPSELTKQAYSQFINENVEAFKKAKATQRYHVGIDEDTGWTLGNCLEDII